MLLHRLLPRLATLLGILPLVVVLSARADDPPAAASADGEVAKSDESTKSDAADPAPPKPATTPSLADQQKQVAAKYKRFEEVLLRMAELTASSDPKRAALLRKTVAEGKQRQVAGQLDKLAEMLREDRLAVALTSEAEVEQDLSKLLDILLSEQRADKLKDERERLKQQVRKIKELINRQQQLQGETATPADAKELAEREARLADEAGKLADSMKPPAMEGDKSKDAKGGSNDGDKKATDQNDDDKSDKKDADSDKKGSDKKGSDKKGSDKQGDDKPSKQGKPKDGKPKKGAKDSQGGDKPDAKPQDGEPQDGEPKDGMPPKKSQQSPPQGQPSDSPPEDDDSPSDDQPQAPQDPPGRKRVAAAQQKMEDARKKLDEAKRDGAQKDQEEAIRELEQAKAELEEILRQMREEEVERVLAQLEARFRKMRDLQVEVYEGTQRLDRVPEADRTRNDEIESGRLSRREAAIVDEADKALVVLHEEGSAAAFPEAVTQMREDMQYVTTLLGEFNVGARTQGVEEDILAALEEMIASLQKAQRDREDKKQNAGQQMGQPGDPPLVDKLSELKMIRALQMRVNTRTKRYAELVQGDVGQAEQADLLEQLRLLAEREERVFRTTRDIVTGKNQ
jgi:hypothetical protein